MAEEIGGYFELELPAIANDNGRTINLLWGNGGGCGDIRFLNTGRNAIEYILRSLGRVACVCLPDYICGSVLEPFHKLGIPYRRYHVTGQLEIDGSPALGNDEYLLYVNYFGIKDSYVGQLGTRYGSRLIVDNSQALYAIPTGNCIYSPRKYIGVPDGGIAVCGNAGHDAGMERQRSHDLCSHLLKRIELGAGGGYVDFKSNSRRLSGLPVRRMSFLSERVLASAGHERIRRTRRANFACLHDVLGNGNRLDVPDLDSFACPMVYPYYTEDGTLRTKLIERKVYVATYWPDVLEDPEAGSDAGRLTERLLPLPIDQRYGREEMKRIIDVIKRTENG